MCLPKPQNTQHYHEALCREIYFICFPPLKVFQYRYFFLFVESGIIALRTVLKDKK